MWKNSTYTMKAKSDCVFIVNFWALCLNPTWHKMMDEWEKWIIQTGCCWKTKSPHSMIICPRLKKGVCVRGCWRKRHLSRCLGRLFEEAGEQAPLFLQTEGKKYRYKEKKKDFAEHPADLSTVWWRLTLLSDRLSELAESSACSNAAPWTVRKGKKSERETEEESERMSEQERERHSRSEQLHTHTKPVWRQRGRQLHEVSDEATIKS